VTIEAVVLPGDADVRREHAHEADVAQAPLFAAALHAEVAALQLRTEEVERWHRQRQRRRRTGDLDPPERLLRLRDELEEATRILNALHDSRLLRPDA
jgi:hypothetical protein